MQEITVFGVTISTWIYAPVVYFLWVSVLLIIKKIVFKQIENLSKKTKMHLDDILVSALDLPITLLVLVSGALVVEKALPPEITGDLLANFLLLLKATTIVAVIIFLDKLLYNVIKVYSPKVDALRTSGGILQGVVRVIVMALGVLILLDSFGVSITPIIASLGVGSLAVALALQPTLENFFSGMQLLIDKPIKVGQFIKLESGEEGYVDKVGWRSTRVRQLPNNMVIIPNKTLVTSRVLNYYYPDQEMAVLVQVGVHYESDLEKVEKVTMEVGKEIMNSVTGACPDFDPFIRYHTFSDFSINFTVILRAKEFVDNYLIKHEFIKALHKRYAAEGINIPYPIRAVNFAQEQVNSQDPGIAIRK